MFTSNFYSSESEREEEGKFDLFDDEDTYRACAIDDSSGAFDEPTNRAVGGFDDDSQGGTSWGDVSTSFGGMSLGLNNASLPPAPLPSASAFKTSSSSSFHVPSSEPPKQLYGDFSTQFGAPPPQKMQQQQMQSSAKQLEEVFGSPNFVEVVVGSPSTKLEEIPFYVEKYSSFYTASEPHTVLTAITNLFPSLHVTFSFQPQQHRIKGMLKDGGCEIAVQAYAGAGSGEYLIEFQRRCGCGIAFKQVYQSCLRFLHKSSHVLRRFEASKCKGLDLADSTAWLSGLESCSASEVARVSLDSVTIKNLFSMASSIYIETQREAVDILALCSADDAANTKALVGEEEWTDVCHSLLMSKDSVVRAKGAEIVANIVKKEEGVRQHVVTVLLDALRDVLKTQNTFKNQQAHSAASCALEVLESTHSDLMFSQQNNNVLL